MTASRRIPAVRADGGPLVSVSVPAFNGALHIGEAIRSVLDQSFEDFELVVVDDCSSDGTAEVVAAFQDDRLALVRNQSRLGLVGNWNRCLDLARGRHVTVFHQDDLMAPDNLASKARFLEEHPTVGLVHSNVAQIDAHGGVLSAWWDSPPRPEDEGLHDGLAYFHRLVTGSNIICASSVVMRRTAFEQLGGFDARLSFTADWEMWLRIALFYDVGYLTQPLVRYRRHGGMETARLSWSQQLEQGYLAKMLVLEKHPDRVPDVEALSRRISREYRDRALARAVGSGARREEFAARLRQAETGAERARARAEELARALDDRDRLIDAMARTRVWRHHANIRVVGPIPYTDLPPLRLPVRRLDDSISDQRDHRVDLSHQAVRVDGPGAPHRHLRAAGMSQVPLGVNRRGPRGFRRATRSSPVTAG